MRHKRSIPLAYQAWDAIKRNGGTLFWVPEVLANSGTFTDSAGTTPATTVGDVLGLMLDKAGTAGPELFSTTLDFNNAAWTPAGGVTSRGVGTFTTSSGGGVYLTLVTASTSAYVIRVVGNTTAGMTIRNTSSVNGSHTVFGSFDVTLNSAIFVEDGNLYFANSGAGTTTISSISVKKFNGATATQPTTNFKPTLQWVPKKLGPNLVVNGEGDSAAGWSTDGGSLAAVAGQLVFTASAGISYPSISQTVPLVVGRKYQVSVYGATGTSGDAPAFNAGSLSPSVNIVITSGQVTTWFLTATATSTLIYAFAAAASSAAGTIIFDNITVQEVLEWSNAISFDGSDDFLQTGITTGNQGWVCAGVRFGAPLGNYETVFSNGAGVSTLKGVWLTRLPGNSDSSALFMGVGNGTAVSSLSAPSGISLLGTARVVEGGWTASTVEVGVDGQTASAARTGDATPAPYTTLVGAYVSGFHHLQGPMTAQVICPVLPSAADRTIIRKWIGSLQGQSL